MRIDPTSAQSSKVPLEPSNNENKSNLPKPQPHKQAPPLTQREVKPSLPKEIKLQSLVFLTKPMEIEENTQVILSEIDKACQLQEQQAEEKKFHFFSSNGNHKEHLLIHTPEMSITGYQFDDLVQVEDELNTRVEEGLAKIRDKTKEKDVSITVGFPYVCTTPDGEKKRMILHALVSQGEIKSIKGKEDLAANVGSARGVEYETRNFVPCQTGTKMSLFGKELEYGKGIFSNEPAEIEGKKVSMVICEEMWTGTDEVGTVVNQGKDLVSAYLKEILDNVMIKSEPEILDFTKEQPKNGINHAQYALLQSIVYNRLEDPNFNVMEQKEFEPQVFKKILEEIDKTFPKFKKGYHQNFEVNRETLLKQDVLKNSKLYQALEKSDIVLVPNGSPSGTGKYNTREDLLNLIGTTYIENNRSELLKNGNKYVMYNNHSGSQAGSISYDGTVTKTTLAADQATAKVEHLSTYSYGLSGGKPTKTPHWVTQEGQKEIIKVIDGTPYFSASKQHEIHFGNLVKNIYPKFYQETEFAYKNLLKHLESFPEGEGMLERGDKRYFGNFVSLSGGFDSAHTLLVRAKGIELRTRQLIYENGNELKVGLNQIVDELKLNRREFDPVLFERFLSQQVNVSDQLDTTKANDFRFKNLDLFCDILGVVRTGDTEKDIKAVIEKLKDVKSIKDLIDLVYEKSSSLDPDQRIEFLSKLMIFHTVKASYLRTENNTVKTERGARLLAMELGADFEVRDIDTDFKMALLQEKFNINGERVAFSSLPELKKQEVLSKYSEILRIEKKSDLENKIQIIDSRLNKINHFKDKGDFTKQRADLESQRKEITAEIEEQKTLLKKLKNELYQVVTGKNDLEGTVDVHNWFESASGLEIENIQARIRGLKNWQIAYEYGLVPTSNPNSDESKQGYTTFIGDEHAGTDSSTADLRKTEILAEMSYMMKAGLHDETQFMGKMTPVKAIFHTFTQPPSAELQTAGAKASDLFSQQTDEDSYGMSYLELSFIGDRLFQLSKNGGSVLRMSDVYDSLKDHPLFHGQNKWELFAKLDKVYGQWHFAAFKRRAAPWQLTNSDVSVDHHANNRIEFGGTTPSIRAERTELLMKLLLDSGIVTTKDQNNLMSNLLFNNKLQADLQNILWNTDKVDGVRPPEKMVDLKALIRLYADTPELLEEYIIKRLVNQKVIENKGANLTSEIAPPKPPAKEIQAVAGTIKGSPINTKARDLAGNLELVKKAMDAAYNEGQEMVVIPDILGTDLGDNVRRIDQTHIDLFLQKIAEYGKIATPHLKVVVGHPRFDAKTKDRSHRYYQSASFIDEGKIETFDATKINNNNDLPGACYDTRTFIANKSDSPQVFQVGNDKFHVLIDPSPVPKNLPKDVKIIHLGAMEAKDQIEGVNRIFESGHPLAISVNAVGSSSGIRVFSGQVIKDQKELSRYEATSKSVEQMLKNDVKWLVDYLPFATMPLTVVLDGTPESLYTLKVVAEKVRSSLPEAERNDPKKFEEAFRKQTDVVTVAFKKEEETIRALKEGAREILGFDPVGEGTQNAYNIDEFTDHFIKSSLLGDIHIKQFSSEDKNWEEVDALLSKKMEGKPFSKADAKKLEDSLKASPFFRKSIEITYRRYCQATTQIGVKSEAKVVVDEKGFQEFLDREVRQILHRVETYVPNKDLDDRAKSVFGWLTSARKGGEGQIVLSNVARNDLCAAERNLFAGRIHAGGVSVTQSHSLEQMRDAFPKGSQAYKLFDQRMKENIVEKRTVVIDNETQVTTSLSRHEVDEIYEFLASNEFNLQGIENLKIFERASKELILGKLKLFIDQWKKNIWDRHALPNGPHIRGQSVDQQASFREPLHGDWLSNQYEMKAKARYGTSFFTNARAK